jgi:predicted DNA-binding WGR domain protein
MSDKRMFEHSDEGKFWEVWIDGANVFTRHGKLGASGQTKLKAGDAAVMEKMIKEKVGAGYVQTGGAVASGPELDKKELKRHLGNIKSFEDTEAISVLSDWLQTQNHPWGELIALQAGAAANPKKAASLTKQAEKHLKQNSPAILGAAANGKHSHFEWKHGLLSRAVIGTPADLQAMIKATKSVLSQPAAHLVESVVLCPYRATFDTWRDWGGSTKRIVDPWTDLAKVAAVIPDRVTKVGLGGWPAPAAAGYVTMPAFSKVSSTFGHVTGLELTGWPPEKLGKLSLPKVTELAVRFARATGEALSALAGAKLPKLERLTVWLGGSSSVVVDDVYAAEEWDEDNEDKLRYPETFDDSDLEAMETGNSGIDCDVAAGDVTTLLSASFSPSLTHLEIGSPKWTPELLTAVVNSPLVKRLTSLTIAGGTIGDDHVRAFTKKGLSHVASLEITGEVADGAAKKLKASFPNLTIRHQEGDFHFRYVATVE